MALRLVLLLVLLVPRLAAAEPDDTKSPGVSLALSAGGTAVSFGVFAGSLMVADHLQGHHPWYTVSVVGLASTIITPSLGEWYAGSYVTPAMGLRLGGALLAIAGASQAEICFDECKPHDNSLPVAVIGLGLTTYLAGVIWDIAAAPSTARKANARRHPTITPTLMTAPSGASAYGLGLGGNF